MQILLTDFHHFLKGLVKRIWQKNQNIFSLVIILLILITFFLDEILILFVEHCFWSLLGLKG